VRRAPVLLAAAALALACNGSIRFDDTTADAAPTDTGGSTCPNGSCGWETESCDGGTCLTCRASMTCVGTCGFSCTAGCEPNSLCALNTGEGAHVTCASGSSCTFVLGENSRAACAAGSTCGVRCSEECTLDCDPAASCHLQCRTGASMAVTGTAICTSL